MTASTTLLASLVEQLVGKAINGADGNFYDLFTNNRRGDAEKFDKEIEKHGK